MAKPDGGQAFPCSNVTDLWVRGMTLRAWLAGQALANPMVTTLDGSDVDASTAANYAVQLADAVIERLEAEDA